MRSVCLCFSSLLGLDMRGSVNVSESNIGLVWTLIWVYIHPVGPLRLIA